MTKVQINNKPEASIIWKGLGGHFDSISQIVNEFLDNSLSNFKANNPVIKNIVISIKEEKSNEIFISLEDSGTGIKNLDSAFTLGCQDSKESPMNEHGFGFKHALATANPENNCWLISTRTKDQFESKKYTEIKAPYKLENFSGIERDINKNPWPGQLNGSGTYIEFKCSRSLFTTVKEGLKGNWGFEGMVELLIEDIGYTYSNLIKEDMANISVIFENIQGKTRNKNIKAVEPDYEKFISPGKGNTTIPIDSNKNVKIEYEFGVMKVSDHKKYYKRNMSTSGVEIRLNGRAIICNLFKEVWNIEKHNSYNYLLIKINMISDNPDYLPSTRTSKNGIRKGDEKLEAVFEWIRSLIGTPTKNMRDIDHEIDLFEKLQELKEKQLPDPKKISTEENVFREVKERIRIDLYEKTSNGVVIYEGKKDKTSVQDLYQLIMYWDGCTIDGIKPDLGILIASEHPQSVKDLTKYINQMKDVNNNNYNLSLKIWKDEGIDYPPVD
mgnify:CR=1 FL=1